MTEQQAPALRRFTTSTPFSRRSRQPSTEKPIPTVDLVEDAISVAEEMPTLLTPEQVASALGVTERTLERWRMRGDGPPYVRLTRSTVRYSKAALAAFVASCVKKNTAQ